MLRNFETVNYLPILSVRPAEMRALEELPEKTKDLLLPVVHLRPWMSAHQLDAVIGRIKDAYDDRPIIIGMSSKEDKGTRPVHHDLDRLRKSDNGFEEWCCFMREHENYIPSVQFSPDTSYENQQIQSLYELGRGIIFIVPRRAFGALSILASRVSERTHGGQGVIFILDLEKTRATDLVEATARAPQIADIKLKCPHCFVSISGSSFPETFAGTEDQEIFERRLFNLLPDKNRLIYSDRGSARCESQKGGGGTPAPRIDYPLRDEWYFYRSEDATGFSGYQEQAQILVRDRIWNPNLRVWGTQMIERTASGDSSAISSPGRATAARINIHLQRQTFYEDPALAEDTDEDWQE
ncbi:beta family protein [Gluconobacter cerinus]|uniref:beta family protein n=1 Tax=Gluconobacter cerinus TaxID=38307 RepID=UPI001B8BC6DD|nr:beta family protein [Gluconobacter cerinus]MBS1070369.1 beta family protein [Gluconobacter cerinus]